MKTESDALIEFKIKTTNDLLDKVKGLIKDPFFENREQYFTNPEWYSALVLNDFFIESNNFAILRKLMELNKEEYFLLTYSTPFIFTPFYKIPINFNIDCIRSIIDEEAIQRYSCWYFFSVSGEWACISEYDGDSLFIGFNKKYMSNA
jgi:hypothetical protein